MRLDQLREPGKFFPWLKKIARNQSKNHLQKAGPRLVPLDSASSHKAPDAPDERILRQELMDAIMQAIQALPPKDTPKGTFDYVRIDYEYIRSALGALPEKIDAYLAEFFAGFVMSR